MHDRPAQYIAHNDGDTVTMLLDQDFYDRKQINIRLANVWAPEKKDPGGLDVKRFVEAWFAARAYPEMKWPFIVVTHVTSEGTMLKTFDRYVASVNAANGDSLNADVMQYILEKGYSGGTGAPTK